MAAAPYFAFGGGVDDNIATTISNGPLKITTDIMLLLHLVAAFPIILNPPAQYFENIMKIPMGKYCISKFTFCYSQFKTNVKTLNISEIRIKNWIEQSMKCPN